MHTRTGMGDKVSHGLVIYFQQKNYPNFKFQIGRKCVSNESGIYKNVTIIKSDDWKSWNGGQLCPWETLYPRLGMAGQKIVHLRSLVPERICICYCYCYVLGIPCALDLVWQGKK
jgi:hypothetical protein